MEEIKNPNNRSHGHEQTSVFAEHGGACLGQPCVLLKLINPSNKIHEIVTITGAAGMLLLGLIISPVYPLNLIVFLLPCLVCAWPVIKKAALNIRRGKFLNQYVLLVLLTVAMLVFNQLAIALALMLGWRAGQLAGWTN